ncbi:hypothetical protein BDV27DRAFT_167789 [Aspergillus caelatus]|uniref:Uncharacterized protein n=1 Tax=Aspergillus caelatus TaxID=61420 RepID=A0A5N7AH08_9EURO|nr:uncharacterized protein BDV27DRAFT_167789 [Aspergillus caelatus]KAE8368568.1 hypothetical protein BDV27DRAFT_167789 [Aspergillus caelatus]
MSFYGGFSQRTWQQAVNYRLITYLHPQRYSESTDIQQSLRDGYSLQTKNQELIQSISVLLCENEKYRQDLEAAHQSYQLAQYASYAAQWTFETQKYYFQSAEKAYTKAQEQTMGYSELLTDACVKTKALEPQLCFRGYTIDHLNAVLEDRQAMIDEYWRRMGQLDNVCWTADLCAWNYNLVEEGEILEEILFRISRAADEMESLCRSYRHFLADKMDIVSEIGDGGNAMWRAASYSADLERDLDALIDGDWSDCGLNPVLERKSSIMFEAQASRGANRVNSQMQEDSKCEYEPPETIPQPSIPIPPGGHPSLGEGQMLASGTQPLQATVVGEWMARWVTRWVGLSESDAGQNNWFHMYSTETQDTFMFNNPQDPVGQPTDPHAFILDVELTQASQETFDCAMLYALPTQGQCDISEATSTIT